MLLLDGVLHCVANVIYSSLPFLNQQLEAYWYDLLENPRQLNGNNLRKTSTVAP